jgi:hypothetical protein
MTALMPALLPIASRQLAYTWVAAAARGTVPLLLNTPWQVSLHVTAIFRGDICTSAVVLHLACCQVLISLATEFEVEKVVYHLHCLL